MQHEQYRIDHWTPLKDFRGDTDTEKHQSSSILDDNAIKQLKRDEDKAIINAIRLAISTADYEKPFSYFQMLNYNKSQKLTIQLCEKLGQQQIASRLRMQLSDMEQRMKLE